MDEKERIRILKISCCTSGFRDIPLDQTLTILEGLGFEYFEGTTDGRAHLYPYIFNDCPLPRLLDILSSHSISLSIVSGGWADFALPSHRLSKQAEIVRKQLEFCSQLGVGTLRLFATHLPGKYMDEHLFDRMILNLRYVAIEASKVGVSIAIENHRGWSETLLAVLCIVQAIDSPSVGITFDPANFVMANEDPLYACKLLLPYIFHVHLKDVGSNGYCAFGEGHMDYHSILTLLKDNGYDGFLSIECEDRKKVIEDTIRAKQNLERTLKEI